MGLTEESLASLRSALEGVGPTAETVQAAINEGFVGQEFTPTPTTDGGGDTGDGDTGDGGTGDGDTGPTVVDTFYVGTGANRKRVTLYSDGTRDIVDDPEDQGPPQNETETSDARALLARALDEYGLGELRDYAFKNIVAKGIKDVNAALFLMRDQPAYQKRFAANAARVKKGLPELEPGTYLDLEEAYKATLRSALGPEMFEAFNDPNEIQFLIEGDVSPAELNSRIQDGYQAVAEADPEVKRQMERLYGVTDQQLVGYFLNPEKATTVLTRQARAAQISARAAEQGGVQLTGTLAEDLARRGITEAEAQRGFAEIGALGELRQTFAGETALTQEQLVGAQFNQNIQAQQELERRRRQRIGEFAGGGQFARTTGATSGAIETGVGTAQ